MMQIISRPSMFALHTLFPLIIFPRLAGATKKKKKKEQKKLQ
jgi:hypothetical protein